MRAEKSRDIGYGFFFSFATNFFFFFPIPYISISKKMFLRPNAILSAASRAAATQRTRVVAPAVFSRMYASLPKEDVQSRVLDVVKSFEKVDAAKVNKTTSNSENRKRERNQEQLYCHE